MFAIAILTSNCPSTAAAMTRDCGQTIARWTRNSRSWQVKVKSEYFEDPSKPAEILCGSCLDMETKNYAQLERDRVNLKGREKMKWEQRFEQLERNQVDLRGKTRTNGSNGLINMRDQVNCKCKEKIEWSSSTNENLTWNDERTRKYMKHLILWSISYKDLNWNNGSLT